MGMVTSCCGRRPKKSRLHSEHDLMSPTHKRHRRDISATYSANDFVMTLDQLNINQATEEELMTLPNINRNIARNILQYRNHIGGFRKAEDLALVSGVGANKLGLIRMEIYCGKYDPGCQATPSSSRKSGHRPGSAPVVKHSPETRVDVNKATPAELSKVSGIGSELAQRIVDFRNEYGHFKFLTDVSKVPDIGTYYFEKIRNYLTIDDNESMCSTSTSVSVIEDFSSDSLPLLRDRPNGSLPSGVGCKKTQVTAATQTDCPAMPTPFATMPRRKSRTLLRRSSSHRIGRVRLASWNLQQLTLEKVRNPGVREVICMTILENGLGLLACQDIVDSTALDEVCAELNHPRLGPVKAWSGPRGNWTSITATSGDIKKQNERVCGFLWDTSQGVRLKHSYQLKLTANRTISSPSSSHHVPFLGRFALLHAELSVLCVSFGRKSQGNGLNTEEAPVLEAVARTIDQYFPDKECMAIACDAFPDQDVNGHSPLMTGGFIQVSPRGQLSNGVQQNVQLVYTNNLLFSTELHKSFRGSCGVVQEGLSHPLIPAGWSWGGVVSDHCLSWAELFFQL
ncbi:endonuclease/exonuclease/phosphatase family domain-containing protein 1-like [Diadema antillarum]|uniref:endonuclease/exonuclease/phosphatase family domain-containing protein 1-like n=1 Tax=Diadema antillarum TaxID=105358 RepID=UPI003A8805A6